jgi:phage/plasmid-like protein (TIGR03299 family)
MGNLESGFIAGLDASGRKPSFFSLPESKCFDEQVSSAEALELAGMNFLVGKRPVFQQLNNGSFAEVSGKFASYRTDNEHALGVVGNQWTAFQNEPAFAMVDELLGFGALVRSAGTWNGGADVFISAQLQNGISVEGVTDVDMYLLFRNNHSGTGAVSCYITPVDLRCTNQLSTAIRSAVSSWKIRHTRTVGERVQEASTTLRLVDEYREALENTIKELSEAEMSLEEFNGFLKEWTDAERVQKTVMDVYQNSPNLTQGNRWGAYSAITETLDHMPSRRTGAETRFASQLDGPIARGRERAMRLLVRR